MLFPSPKRSSSYGGEGGGGRISAKTRGGGIAWLPPPCGKKGATRISDDVIRGGGREMEDFTHIAMGKRGFHTTRNIREERILPTRKRGGITREEEEMKAPQRGSTAG